MKLILATATVSLGFLAGINPAQGFSLSLYDGTNAAQPLPVNQGQLIGGAILSTGLPTFLDETALSGTGVVVVSDGNGSEYAGYANFIPIPPAGIFVNPAFPALDPTVGYSLSFRVGFEVLTSSDPDRAGFSVTLVSSNGQGIELGFDPSSIFAQSDTFSAAERALFSTLSTTDYVVTVLGSNYQLSANGTPILAGSLRNYVFNPATSIPPLAFNPYTTNNFLFLGDNTGQGSSTFTFESAEIAFVPVPPQFVGMVLLGVIQLWRRLSAAAPK
ncbi:MAG: hypothetical protein KME35_18320 [Aphanocapsa sp. GSE-SYN-MK-11-07L]|jgi:hypothetical protein|nr:hypothetical protein [Aphanocapsa sp. GSE-SYN-MK-11-07L]